MMRMICISLTCVLNCYNDFVKNQLFSLKKQMFWYTINGSVFTGNYARDFDEWKVPCMI